MGKYWVTNMDTGHMRGFYMLEDARAYRETLTNWKMEWFFNSSWKS